MIENYEFNIKRPIFIKDNICREIESIFKNITFDTRTFSPEMKEKVKMDALDETEEIYKNNKPYREKAAAGFKVDPWYLRIKKEIFWYAYKGHFMEVKPYMDFNFINDDRPFMDLLYKDRYTVDVLTTMKYGDKGLVDKIEQFAKRRNKKDIDGNKYLLADRILSFYTQSIDEWNFKFKLQACVMSDPVNYKKKLSLEGFNNE